MGKAGYARLTFVHDSGVTCYVRLYDKNLQELSRWDISGDTTRVITEKVGIPAGTYYISVSPSYYYGHYHFVLNKTAAENWETEYNNDQSRYDTVKSGTTYYGSLTYYDTDFYKITVGKQGYLKTAIVHNYLNNSSRFCTFKIYTSDMKELAKWDISGNTSKYTTACIGVPAGTYYLSFDCSYVTDEYRFKPVFTEAAGWETEPNNDTSSYDVISTGKTYHGSLTYTDNDYYRFKVTEQGNVQIKFLHDTFDTSNRYCYLRLYNSNFEEIIYWNVAGNASSFLTAKVGLPVGVYYLRVQNDYSSLYGNYYFKILTEASSVWETEINNTMDKADKIAADKTYYGGLYDGDNDYFKLTLSSKTKLRIRTIHDAKDSSSTFAWVYLYNSNGEEIANWSTAGNVSKLVTEYLTLAKGTYYIKVSEAYCNGGGYEIRVMS